MELRHLRYFVAVAEELHFTRAADRLNMSQPPLSQRIMELERELRVTLFERTRRRVELTVVGKHFLEYARETLARLDTGVEIVRQIARHQTGQLVIGWEPLIELGSVPRMLHEVCRRHPEARIQLRTLQTTDLLRGLHDGRIDAAFMSPPAAEDGLVVNVFAREPLMAVLSDGHHLAKRATIRASELAAECHVRLAPRAAPALARCVAELLAHEKIAPATEVEVDTPLSVLRLVGRGAGVSFLPASASAAGIPNCVYRPIAGQARHVESALVVGRADASPFIRHLTTVALGTGGRPAARAA